MREIDWRLSSIVARNNRDMKFSAQVHGMEMKIPEYNSSKPTKISEGQEKAIEMAFSKAKAGK